MAIQNVFEVMASTNGVVVVGKTSMMFDML
jgi:hypothetical protein